MLVAEAYTFKAGVASYITSFHHVQLFSLVCTTVVSSQRVGATTLTPYLSKVLIDNLLCDTIPLKRRLLQAKTTLEPALKLEAPPLGVT